MSANERAGSCLHCCDQLLRSEEGDCALDIVGEDVEAGFSSDVLIDVRQLPQSRRPGFSKRVLSETLVEAGIAYRHVLQLGDPKSGRDAARRGDMDEFRSIFGAHLALDETQAALVDAAADVKRHTVAPMCFERAPKDCQRFIVAQRIQGLTSAEVVHLGVHPGRSAGRIANGAAGCNPAAGAATIRKRSAGTVRPGRVAHMFGKFEVDSGFGALRLCACAGKEWIARLRAAADFTHQLLGDRDTDDQAAGGSSKGAIPRDGGEAITVTANCGPTTCNGARTQSTGIAISPTT